MKNIIKPFLKGYKFRIYPNKLQQEYLAKVFGSCRFVYNYFLDRTIKEYEKYKLDSTLTKPNLSAFSLCYGLKPLKDNQDTNWLKESPSHVLQASLYNLANAYSIFFKNKKGYPKFKSKHGKQSATYSCFSYTLKDNILKLAKCNLDFKVKWSRDLPTNSPGELVVSKTSSGKYYVSFICEYLPKITTGKNIIGIDAGITDLATISNGTVIPNLRSYTISQKKLCKLQRRLSKKKKGSKNRNKARIKVALLHEHISNQRIDYLHKLTTRLVRENQAIAIESLQIKNMVRNRKLSKHILDAGWGIMREQLKYKCTASQHCKLILADPYFPSTQLCHVCNTKPKLKLSLGTRKWTCSNCQSVHQRDFNASKNLEILAKSWITDFPSGVNVLKSDPYIPYLE